MFILKVQYNFNGKIGLTNTLSNIYYKACIG
jgi:hypothetical protein